MEDWGAARDRLAAPSTVTGTWGAAEDGPWCVKREADIRAALERVEALERDYAEVQDISVSESVGRRAAEAEVERLRQIVKGVHGALTDAGSVVVPGSLDADLYAPVMQLVKERDEAKANIALLDQAATDYRKARDKAEAKVERFKAALTKMSKDGCGFAPRTCPQRSPDPEQWCWSCQASAVLAGGGE